MQSGSIRDTHTEKFLTEQKDVTVGSKRKPRWFDIRDELSAPTVVYVKWRRRERKIGGQTKYEPRIIRANNATSAEKMTLGETAAGEITRKESQERGREIRHSYHMVDN